MSIQSNFPAIKPTLLLDFANVKALDPRITFTRASTGTFYGTQTAKAEENLLIRSQEFDSANWGKTNSTVTANTDTAPDGTLTADTLTFTTGAGFTNQQADGLNTALSYTFSVWMRTASGTLSVGIGSLNAGVFVTQTVTTTWTRFSVTQTPTAATRFPGIRAEGTTGDIFIWGAQLEQRSAVTAYTATTTQPITNYIPVLQTAASGVARFDHNPITDESLGLLIEEQRTNLLTYSEQFNDAAWTKTNSSITANTAVAPDGALTGDALIENTATSEHVLIQTATTASNSARSFSVYAKASGRSVIRLLFDRDAGFTDYCLAIFDLASGTVVSASNAGTGSGAAGTIVAVGNGWYRCTLTGTPSTTAGTTLRNIVYLQATSGGGTGYTGNGYSGVFIWGAQLEAGAFPTSYIQTVASQATRAADAASMTGANFSSWYNQAEGTVYCESATSSFSTNMGAWAIGNPSLAFASGNMMYEVYSASSGQRAVSGFSNGSAQFVVGPTVAQTVNTFTRGAFGYAINNFVSIVSASAASSDTSGTVPQGVTGLSIGGLQQGWNGAANPLNGTIRKLAYYPVRIQNAQLQGLTS
jgi:hypothetical protein